MRRGTSTCCSNCFLSPFHHLIRRITTNSHRHTHTHTHTHTQPTFTLVIIVPHLQSPIIAFMAWKRWLSFECKHQSSDCTKQAPQITAVSRPDARVRLSPHPTFPSICVCLHVWKARYFHCIISNRVNSLCTNETNTFFINGKCLHR